MLLLLLKPPELRMLELTPMLRLGENADTGVAVASRKKRAVFIMVVLINAKKRKNRKSERSFEILRVTCLTVLKSTQITFYLMSHKYLVSSCFRESCLFEEDIVECVAWQMIFLELIQYWSQQAYRR